MNGKNSDKSHHSRQLKITPILPFLPCYNYECFKRVIKQQKQKQFFYSILIYFLKVTYKIVVLFLGRTNGGS